MQKLNMIHIHRVYNFKMTQIFRLAKNFNIANATLIKDVALAGMTRWIECRPVNWKFAGSIPSQGTCLGCGHVPSWGYARGNWSMFLSHIYISLPLFLPSFSSL